MSVRRGNLPARGSQRAIKPGFGLGTPLAQRVPVENDSKSPSGMKRTRIMKKILVLGGNFGGVTAALEAKRLMKDKVQVKVVSRTADFVYIPSVIWVP